MYIEKCIEECIKKTAKVDKMSIFFTNNLQKLKLIDACL